MERVEQARIDLKIHPIYENRQLTLVLLVYLAYLES